MKMGVTAIVGPDWAPTQRNSTVLGLKLAYRKILVTLCTDFSFKQLKKNAVAAKGKSFRSLVSKGFSFKE